MSTYIELGGVIDGYFRRKFIINKDDKEKEIKKHNFKDTYSTIFEYDNKEQNIANYVAPLYFDLDIDDIENKFLLIKTDVLMLHRKLKTLFDLKDDNIEIYFSGSKGFHLVVPYTIFGLSFSKGIDKDYKLLAKELNSYTITKSIDTKIYESKRLFREVNTINSKTGLYKVMLSIEQLRSMNYSDLIDYASSPKEVQAINKEYNEISKDKYIEYINSLKDKQKSTINYKVVKSKMANKELLPCVKYVLQHGANKGNRNNTTLVLASALYQRDIEDKDGVLNIMRQWNEKKLDTPLPENELYTTVMSAYKNVKNGRCCGCSSFINLDICVKGCPVRKL